MALGHCGQNNEQGKSILCGSAYSGNKTILLDGIKDVTQAAEQALKDHEDQLYRETQRCDGASQLMF